MLEIFSTYCAGKFDQGGVEIATQASSKGRYFWIRPRHHIGSEITHRPVGKICAACRRPEKWSSEILDKDPGGRIIKNFGKAQWNLALVGKYPWNADVSEIENVPPNHDAAYIQPNHLVGTIP